MNDPNQGRIRSNGFDFDQSLSRDPFLAGSQKQTNRAGVLLNYKPAFEKPVTNGLNGKTFHGNSDIPVDEFDVYLSPSDSASQNGTNSPQGSPMVTANGLNGLLDVNISTSNFTKAINFEALKNQNGLFSGSNNRHLGATWSPSQTSQADASGYLLEQSLDDSSMDLLEQQQAKEQSRLLDRFKQLRQWQVQQQETLMRQQQEQLLKLQEEQEQVQRIIARQREMQWGASPRNAGAHVQKSPPGNSLKFHSPRKSTRPASSVPQALAHGTLTLAKQSALLGGRDVLHGHNTAPTQDSQGGPSSLPGHTNGSESQSAWPKAEPDGVVGLSDATTKPAAPKGRPLPNIQPRPKTPEEFLEHGNPALDSDRDSHTAETRSTLTDEGQYLMPDSASEANEQPRMAAGHQQGLPRQTWFPPRGHVENQMESPVFEMSHHKAESGGYRMSQNATDSDAYSMPQATKESTAFPLSHNMEDAYRVYQNMTDSASYPALPKPNGFPIHEEKIIHFHGSDERELKNGAEHENAVLVNPGPEFAVRRIPEHLIQGQRFRTDGSALKSEKELLMQSRDGSFIDKCVLPSDQVLSQVQIDSERSPFVSTDHEANGVQLLKEYTESANIQNAKETTGHNLPNEHARKKSKGKNKKQKSTQDFAELKGEDVAHTFTETQIFSADERTMGERYHVQRTSATSFDDVPVKGIAGSKKTFEELLEEELQKEQQVASVDNVKKVEAVSNKGSTFLRKGQGVARFGMAPKPLKTSKNEKAKTKPTVDQTKMDAPRKIAGKALEQEVKTLKLKQSPKKPASDRAVTTTKLPAASANDAVGEVSFRQRMSKLATEEIEEKEELVEFEILEKYADDNASFLSNVSAVNRKVAEDKKKMSSSLTDGKDESTNIPAGTLNESDEDSEEESGSDDDDTSIDSETAGLDRDDTLVEPVNGNPDDSNYENKRTEETNGANEEVYPEERLEALRGIHRKIAAKSPRSPTQEDGMALKTLNKVQFNDSDSDSDSDIEQSENQLGTRHTRPGFNSAQSEGEQDNADHQMDQAKNSATDCANGAKQINHMGQITLNKFSAFREYNMSSTGKVVPKEQSGVSPGKPEYALPDDQKKFPNGVRIDKQQSEIKQNICERNKSDTGSSDAEDSEMDTDKNKEVVPPGADKLEFEDDEAWDETSGLQDDLDAERRGSSSRSQQQPSRANQQSGSDVQAMRVAQDSQGQPQDVAPPPTSRLVEKLFPKLKKDKPKPLPVQQVEAESKRISAAPVGDGVQSKALRDKLMELESEIEKFRQENLALTKLRKEREEGIVHLKKEMAEFEKQKNEELKRLQEFKNEEMKKLKKERKVFDMYQKNARSGPDKKEREEIESLKGQLSELQEEIKRKEIRWTGGTSRLRDRIEQLETENSELKEEIRVLEKRRLENWQKKTLVAKQPEPSGATRAVPEGLVRKSTPTLMDAPQPETRTSQTEDNALRLSGGSTEDKVGVFKPVHISKEVHPREREDAHGISEPLVTGRRTSSPTVSPRLSQDDGKSRKSIPRKRAMCQNISATVDKGDEQYQEVQHTDGKVEKIYSNGAREILFPNGTRKQVSSDGQSIIVSFFNGDIKQIMPDRRVVYYYSETQTTHTTYPDGLEILQFPNDQMEKHYPDGTKEITFPDQAIKYLFPNGTEESIFADGTVIRIEKNGEKIAEYPNGQREIHTELYKRREYPDGTVKTVYPDGRQETRYSNGRIRVKDKDGSIIVDKKS